MWTLAYNGTEQALADWDIGADFECEFVNKGRDTVTLRTVEAFDAAPPQFTYKQPVAIWRDRTAATGGGFSGGTLFFQGYVGEVNRQCHGGKQWIEYRLFGPWWLLERLRFLQSRSVFEHYATSGQPASGAVLTQFFLTKVYLGETANEAYQTNGQQLVEVLNWVNECYNPTKRGATTGRDDRQDVLRIGTIDPAVNMPKSRVNDIFCSEALVNVLRWSPDVVVWWDYATTPPTFNARAMANLAAVAVTITAEQERQLAVAPQYSRQLAGVWINYKWTNTFNGVPWPQVAVDAYPAGLTVWTPDVARSTIELTGAQVTWASVDVVVEPVAAAVTGDAAARVAFWLALDKTLSDPNIDSSSIVVDGATVTDESGNAVDTSATGLPNVLVKGQLAEPMGVAWTDATITATVSFNRYAGSQASGSTDPGKAVATAMVEQRQINHRVTLTNAVSKTYQYITASSSGEAIPTGVAQAVYQSLASLQHAGTVVFVAGQLRSGPGVGNVMTLTGPANTYANLLVQSVRCVPHLGRCEASFGPSSVLDAPELVELARVGRFRFIYNMPSGRATGEAPGGADVGLGSATAKENTQHGLGNYSFQAATCDQGTSGGNPNGTTQVAQDAKNEVFLIERLDSSGNVMTADGAGNALGQVRLALADTGGKALSIREMYVCDPSTGTKKVRVLASASY